MGQVADWWLNRRLDGEWQVPISSVQGFRPIGGYLVGTASSIEFVPNRFEAMVGASSWSTSVADIQSVSLGRGRLRIVCPDEAGGTRTLRTNRPKALRKCLAALID
jgi:hypothetical protein